MSDCSINAMKSKEMPNTCGDHEPACNFMWAKLQETEQQYQQLEQVAVKMQKCLQAHADDWTEVAQVTADYYADELESLGVSIDD